MKLLLLPLILSITLTTSAQSWQWGARGGGGSNGGANTYPETVIDMATDNAGNVYVLGHVNANAPITLTGVPNAVGGVGSPNILVCSYDCNGQFRWKKSIGGSFGAGGTAIGVDTLGNVNVLGTVTPVQQPPNQPPRFDTDTSFTHSNIKFMFLVQYDTAGNYKWLRQPAPDTMAFARQFTCLPRDMIVNANGEVEILCYLSPGLLSGSNIVVDTPSAYILKYDKDGNITNLVKPDLNWRQAAGDGMAPTSFRYLRMAKTPLGRYIIAGGQNLTNPIVEPLTLGGMEVRRGMFAASFDMNWNFQWKAVNDTTLYWFNYRPSIDSSGNIYLTGNACDLSGFSFNGFTFQNALNPNSPTSMPFMAKLDSNGNNIWVSHAAAKFTCSAGSGIFNGKHPYISGNYTYLNWDTLNMYKPSGNGIFLIQLDPITGALVKADSLRGSSGDVNYTTAIASDKNGNIYLGGEIGSNFTIGSSTLQSAGGNSDFFIAKYGNADCSGTIVPVRLITFTAILQNNDVLTRWQTAQEQNTKAFIVERSTNAVAFTPIGTVPAKGNSNVVQTYSFTDTDLFPSANSQLTTHNSLFYRLKILDLDGSYTYSSIAKINLSAVSGISIYPNPARATTIVSYALSARSTNNVVELYSMLGHKISSTTLPAHTGTQTLNTAALPGGIYNVVLRSNGKVVGSEKLVVEK